MAEPFISEIRMWGFNWAPRGWALCDGSTLDISQNQALYALLGTTYGGDGRTTFNLPDLRGRVPVSMGNNQSIQFALGAHAGEENVTLSSGQMGQHTHGVRGTATDGNAKQFNGAIFASGYDAKTKEATDMYAEPNNLVSLNANSVSINGGGASHPNIQPSLVVNFCIALTGEFPSRN